MDAYNFDEIYEQGREIARVLGRAYREATGEELDVEGALRHYPLVTLGIAAGLGAMAGWWVAHRRLTALPPPAPALPPDETKSSGEHLLDSFRDLASRFVPPPLVNRSSNEPTRPLDRFLPDGIDAVRRALPEIRSIPTAEQAQQWLESAIDPQVRENVAHLAEGFSQSKFGAFLKQALGENNESHGDDSSTPDKPV